MQTKAELIETMRQLGACPEALYYVCDHKSNDAVGIWKDCDNVGWMIWFLGRMRPDLIRTFARDCADRANNYARNQNSTTSLTAAHVADQCAYAYASTGNSAATYAQAAQTAASFTYFAAKDAGVSEKEKVKQLNDLHSLGSALFKDEM